MKEMDDGKATTRDNVILKISNANSRWLTNGSDHNRNYNFSMLSDNDLSILCYFPAAITSLKVP